ncbi:MAG: 4Fe-4S binding protein, partial [Lachnospiraceae bacterium]|nr:4Fe-4S binding protein [Lachnospiraceae bacterium]
YAVTKRKINSKVLPAEVGCIVDNVDTVIAIGEAVCESKPLVRRIMTIAGDGFNQNENLEVRLGTSYTTVIEEVGGLKDGVKKMISGGPMMGVAIYDVNIPVSKSSSAFLAFMKDPIEKLTETTCIRCGKCVEACPINLLPTNLAHACAHDEIEKFVKLDGMECIECGSCSYVCPAKKPLTQYFRAYKTIARNYLQEKSNKEAK